MNTRRFAGKVALITGAGAGIGKGIALRLSTEGATIVIAEINVQTGQQTVDTIIPTGGDAVFIPTDVTDENSIHALITAAIKKYGRLDILVNNAGASPRKPLSEMTSIDWHRIINLNLTSQFLCSQTAQPFLAQNPGACIINIASLHAFMTVPGLSAYATSKGGVVALTRSLAIEYAPNIRVNAVAPGLIETEAWYAAVGDVEKARQHRLKFHPVGRLGKPEDIAAAVAFLASEDASFINGVTLPVDGGLTTQLYRDE